MIVITSIAGGEGPRMNRLQRDQGCRPFLHAHLDGRIEGPCIRINAITPGPINTPILERSKRRGAQRWAQ